MLKLDEFQFIDQIKQTTYNQSSLIKGIGDDAAVFRERVKNTVIAQDTFVDGVHFSNKTMSPFYIGYRVLAANISDLAAMGAVPTYYLVSVVVPKSFPNSDLIMIYDGMRDLASQYAMDLIGGDTVSGDQLVVSVTVIGTVDESKARYRHTAEVGDVVFVTGTVGDSRAGLHILLNDLDIQYKDYLIKRHQSPEPRVHFAQLLRKVNRVTLNDVSDGIASELYEIAKASNKSIVLYEDNIPVHHSLFQFPKEKQKEWKLFGGEDFELVGTVKKEKWLMVQRCADIANISVTKIGFVKELKDNLIYIKNKDKLTPLNKRGYIHLK